MDLGLHDRVYIVTGGSKGLGRATAEALVADGARVVISSRDAGNVERAAADLGGDQRAVGIAADNTDPATPDRLVATAHEHFGRLDGALISVGGPPAGPATEITDEQWRSSFDTVFLGATRLARRLAGELDAGGSIAFVLSASVREPLAGLSISNALRPGLAGLAKTLADELGPYSIRVNGLLPGRLATDRVRELDARAGDEDEVRRQRSASIPLRRYGNPAELGRVAAFVLSPAASYLTGVMLPVDGGAIRGF